MIGGLTKSVSRLAIIAAAGAMSTTGVMAADLGGNCCSDLEERIAELEATTVRKGNRRVSLEVSGHVNEGVLWWDDGVDRDAYIATNVQSRTRFRFKGSATINTDWSAGFLIEIGMTRPGGGTTITNDDSAKEWRQYGGNDDRRFTNSGLDTRHQALWIKSKHMGTVWIGHTSDATDGITQLCLGCTMGNYGQAAAEDHVGGFRLRTTGGGYSADTIGSYIFSAEGGRTAVVKYISPTFAGFSLSANWADAETDRDDPPGTDRGVVTDDGWGVALRYAGEFGAIRVAAGIGYSETGGSTEETGGSLSIAHTPTGLYIAGGLGKEETTTDERDTWDIRAGINSKWNSLGKTHFGGYYANFERTSNKRKANVWGLTLNQKIDAAAMEIYLQYHNIDAKNASEGDLQNFHFLYMGTRIRF